MKCCDITASMLKSQITIQRRSEVSDGMGGNRDGWATQAQPRAMVKPVSGRERAYAGRVEAQVDFRAVIRFVGDVNRNPAYTADDRVVFQGQTFGIDYAIDMETAHKWIELGLRAAK